MDCYAFWESFSHRDMKSSLIRFLDHLPGMAYRCLVEGDFQYRLIFASKGCERLLGITAKQAMDSATNVVEQMTLEGDLTASRKAIRAALRHRKKYELFYRIRTPSNEIKWIWDQGEGVFYDDTGGRVFLEGIMMDVTEQKTAELRLQKENRRLRSAVATPNPAPMVGTSPVMQRLYPLLIKAAQSDVSVILYGETGVGKDITARTIHELSKVKGSYIPVNCGAIPEHLLESEFFGHTRGAFSGAVSSRQGYLAAAGNGTLFLDEVAELPLHLQVKLLRALNDKTFTPVGSETPQTSSFRLISATNRNLQELVRNKTMRADFYYRIHVLPITVPPLRERKEDIPLLAADYAHKKGIDLPLPKDVLRRLMDWHWPGNIRELYNALEHYRVFGEIRLDGGLSSGRTDPPLVLAVPDPSAHKSPFREQRDAAGDKAVKRSLPGDRELFEKKRILAALEENDGKTGLTAASLGITPRTLQRKLKKFGRE